MTMTTTVVGGRFGFVGCDLHFWAISFILLSAEAFFNCFFAVVIYKFIVPHQRTIHAYLIGYSLVLPAIVVSPFVLLWCFPTTNIAFLLCLVGGTASLILFRCIEAMHGTLPAFAKSSLGSFAIYYASALQFNIDEKTGKAIPVTKKELLRKSMDFVSTFVKTSLLYSILMPHGYKLFSQPPAESFGDLFHWGNLANNFLMTSLTSLVLESGSTGLGILTGMLTGWSVIDFEIDFDDSPLTKSESLSYFWSRRWNKVTQSGLRRGVYLPHLHNGFSRTIAAMVTFLASGILHEYVMLIMTQRRGQLNNPTLLPFAPNYGNHLKFFLWCAVAIFIEKVVQRPTPIFWIKKHFPQPIRTALVLLTVLPIVHLFCDEYVESSFYSDAAMGFAKIEYLGELSLN